jgi:hypothetical protein
MAATMASLTASADQAAPIATARATNELKRLVQFMSWRWVGHWGINIFPFWQNPILGSVRAIYVMLCIVANMSLGACSKKAAWGNNIIFPFYTVCEKGSEFLSLALAESESYVFLHLVKRGRVWCIAAFQYVNKVYECVFCCHLCLPSLLSPEWWSLLGVVNVVVECKGFTRRDALCQWFHLRFLHRSY